MKIIFEFLILKKQIAGYFDPDYGEIYPPEKETELIEQMHKNREKNKRRLDNGSLLLLAGSVSAYVILTRYASRSIPNLVCALNLR